MRSTFCGGESAKGSPSSAQIMRTEGNARKHSCKKYAEKYQRLCSRNHCAATRCRNGQSSNGANPSTRCKATYLARSNGRHASRKQRWVHGAWRRLLNIAKLNSTLMPKYGPTPLMK